ncbi:hypothetical protein [Algoriphagus sanaruensis]|uniref:Porin n=1 Tax=Algoriphagus sanaruensis TaxID=1727163 RepID=A0A142EMX6_9BACT|nr:hypothetical protein [Algoriphagus sanaruensis]AMQ56481.1 hypothetical protein AO498_08635 [Algoriphagus sanaruensis]
MKSFLSISLLFLGFVSSIQAQEKERKIDLSPEVHFRTFWMNTDYPSRELKSDYALGMSLYSGINLTFNQNFSFSAGYRSFANAISSDYWLPDPITGQSNRYEAGLFDLLDTRDRFFGRMERLSISYSLHKFGLSLGRMDINTDWVNAQDGRLSPTVMEGIKAWFKPSAYWKFNFWAINRLNIRGSSEWLGIGETIGIFPQGRNISGKPGNYFQNTSSKRIGIAEADRSLGESSKLHFSMTHAQNIFNTYGLTFENNRKLTSKTLLFGIQSGLQHGLGNGGNDDSNLRYKDPKDVNYSISGRIGLKNSNWTTHLNVLHVGGKGRWLSPREWGKDAWYTFIPRERNEGFSKVNAVVGYGEYRFAKVPLSIYLHSGIHWLPDVSNAAENKYAMPSYQQTNFGLKIQSKWIKGLDVHLILVSKQALHSENLTPNQIFNKVELIHFNSIINWKW